MELERVEIFSSKPWNLKKKKKKIKQIKKGLISPKAKEFRKKMNIEE